MRNINARILLLFIQLILAASAAEACACGCGVFQVGTRWMMVTSPGPRLFLQYAYLDQSQNWSNTGQVSPDLNDDRLIRTSFFTLGGQYMFDRSWGVMASVPVWDRIWQGIGDDGTSTSVRHQAVGDVKLMGMYTGFSEDMSTGIMAGLKLPTGPIAQTVLDRDTQIGTGTTDALFTAYQMGQETGWGWFVQGSANLPLYERDGYRPGADFNCAAGIHFDNLFPSAGIAPLASLIGSFRGSDSGPAADPANTGYSRIFFSPGVEMNLQNGFRLDAEVGIPLYSNIRGYQLISPLLLNTSLSYQF
ncbi:MAG TPA: hypothetical protein VMW43_13310 [Bacteroidota bacterium]|nr:hypothetical protein [Bacteroidota bacterium]